MCGLGTMCRVVHGHPGQGYEPVRHGSYTPIHSVPVGFGDVGQAAPSGAYAPYGQNHPAYAVSYPTPWPGPANQGYDAGFGYGHGSQSYPHGYSPRRLTFFRLTADWVVRANPSSSSSYYTSYAPGTQASYNTPVATSDDGNPNASGLGRGGIPGGIASALNAVEGIAGKQTRTKLEKTVKSLSNCECFCYHCVFA